MHQVTHFIDGQRTEGTSGRTKEVFNPVQGAPQATVPLADEAEVDAAIASSQAATRFTRAPPRTRRTRRRRAADRPRPRSWCARRR